MSVRVDQASPASSLAAKLVYDRIWTLPDRLLDLLPVGVYVCDRSGMIVRYNRAASALWGCSPRIGEPEARYCGSYRMFDLAGGHVPHAACPMAQVLATGHGLSDQSIVIERPDGRRICILVNIDPLTDESGIVVGAVTVFHDNTERRRRLLRADGDATFLEGILRSLPVAICMTDADGRINSYNDAAAELWGTRPEIGRSEFCGSWRLFRPDGTSLPHDECPMALALRERRPISGMEAVAERPDGTRINFLAYPTPIFDPDGKLIGAVNMMIDVSCRREAEQVAQRLAAIVESSDDAILTKDVNGVITSWNQGAQRLFGYTAEEAVGKSVTILIPEDRINEEPEILGRILRGDRVDHYETTRRRKDGNLLDISLTVSPLRDSEGRIIGASKIARDITDRHRAAEQQSLLLREMDHRIKNLFTLCMSLVSLSARTARTAEELAAAVQQRLEALARAHTLTLRTASPEGVAGEGGTGLHALIRTILAPYDEGSDAGRSAGPDTDGGRVLVRGSDIAVGRGSVTSIALLLHEFATNAAKYGALSAAAGRVEIDCREAGDRFVIDWRERGGPPPATGVAEQGFGSMLARTTVKAHLGGEISQHWAPEGLAIELVLDRARVTT